MDADRELTLTLTAGEATALEFALGLVAVGMQATAGRSPGAAELHSIRRKLAVLQEAAADDTRDPRDGR